MCSHYQGIKEAERYRRHFGVEPPAAPGKTDLWPGYAGSFVRRHPLAQSGDDAVPAREALPGLFGLVPHWSPDTQITRHTYNARTETAAAKPSFRDAWKHGQHCIIPAEAFFEPDWRSGKPIPTRIARADGVPMGIAGLWSAWQSPAGELVYSYSMLTLNADKHPLMQLFHKPTDEKRMVVILPESSYEAWLHAGPNHSGEFIRQFPSAQLLASGPEAGGRANNASAVARLVQPDL
jgi:putative SOS response-associated peptidase YedK